MLGVVYCVLGVGCRVLCVVAAGTLYCCATLETSASVPLDLKRFGIVCYSRSLGCCFICRLLDVVCVALGVLGYYVLCVLHLGCECWVLCAVCQVCCVLILNVGCCVLLAASWVLGVGCWASWSSVVCCASLDVCCVLSTYALGAAASSSLLCGGWDKRVCRVRSGGPRYCCIVLVIVCCALYV